MWPGHLPMACLARPFLLEAEPGEKELSWKACGLSQVTFAEWPWCGLHAAPRKPFQGKTPRTTEDCQLEINRGTLTGALRGLCGVCVCISLSATVLAVI